MIVAHIEKRCGEITIRYCIDVIDLHEANMRIKELNAVAKEYNTNEYYKLVAIEDGRGLLKSCTSPSSM